MFPPLASSARIPLTNGGFAVVDGPDADSLGRYRWRAIRLGKHAYARADRGAEIVLMHRLLMGLGTGDGRVIDHVDGDGLNNTRINLRICTPTQNAQHRVRTSNCTGYKGVYRRRGKFVAQIGAEKHYLGIFGTAKEAAAAYNRAAQARFGAFAALNTIPLCGE